MEMRKRLLKRFHDKEYRESYLTSFLNTLIASQIRALREKQHLSQAELGEKIGTTQPGISALESVTYSKWSLRTLRKLARAFDVALVVRFESYGEALEDIVEFNDSVLEKPSFPEDPVFQAKPLAIKTLASFAFRPAPKKSSGLSNVSIPLLRDTASTRSSDQYSMHNYNTGQLMREVILRKDETHAKAR